MQLVVATEWPEFRPLELADELVSGMRRRLCSMRIACLRTNSGHRRRILRITSRWASHVTARSKDVRCRSRVRARVLGSRDRPAYRGGRCERRDLRAGCGCARRSACGARAAGTAHRGDGGRRLEARATVERAGRGGAPRVAAQSTCWSTIAGVYGPKGADRGHRLGRVGAGDRDQSVRCGAACRALVPQFKRRGYGKIIQLSGGGATEPLPRRQRVRRLEGRASCDSPRRWREEVEAFKVDVNCDRARRAQHAAARRGPCRRARARRRGSSTTDRSSRSESGGAPLEQGRGARRLSRVASERRHHRPADQRRVGPLEGARDAARASWRARTSTRCGASCPTDRGKNWASTSERCGDRRLRADRRKRAEPRSASMRGWWRVRIATIERRAGALAGETGARVERGGLDA